MIADLLPCSQSPTVLPHVAYVEFIPYPYFPLSKICFICLSFPSSCRSPKLSSCQGFLLKCCTRPLQV